MNTFLPYPDSAKSAKCLDYRRLGKQRVEVLQLLKALTVPGAGWVNHPCTKMWRGFEQALVAYGIAICQEWRSRGYNDSCLEKIMAFGDGIGPKPPWLGDEDFHRSHRSNLSRKDLAHYSQYWDEPTDLPYIWGHVHAIAKS